MVMAENKKKMWHLALRQGLSLIVISAVVALAVNQFRPGSVNLVGDWSAEARMTGAHGDLIVISLEEARKLFEIHEATFIDARSDEQHRQGHIKGALSLPWQRVHDYFVEIAEQLDPDKPIITYCDGESCDLSHDLALFLKDMGFNDSKVLVNGWSLWLKAGLPVTTDSGADEE
jgi:rhodanese-related sulfurtransferase